ncbi:amidohydrolase [bacterium]|nr:amidohydrolase [bacterium]
MSAKADLLIKAKNITTLDPARDFVEKDLCIAITGDTISYIGKADGAPDATNTIDYKDHWVMPGLINAHTHLPMTLLRGFSDDVPLKDWLEKHIFPAEGRLVSPEFCRLGSKIAALEAMLSGTTTVCDMYYFEPDIADVMDQSGMKAFLGQSFIDFPAPDNKKQDGNDYKLLEELIERYGSHSRIHPVVAPHAPYTCGDETLKATAAFAKKHNLLYSIHVSETDFEMKQSQEQYGMTPVARLQKLGVFETRSVFAHCVHVTDDDIKIMAKSPTAVIYNPESNMKLGSGAARIRKMLDEGVLVGLGTDGCASNNDLNMFGEMNTGAKLQKVSLADNAAITAKEMLIMATRDGAKALGLQDTGYLAVGKKADIISVNLRHSNLQPVHDIPSLIYSVQGHEVQDVWIDGKQTVKDHKCLTIDQDAVFDELAHYRERMDF